MAKIPPLPKRQLTRRSVDYKLRLLQEADACSKRGELSALLRREGVDPKTLRSWRRARDTWLSAQERGLATGLLSPAAEVRAARDARSWEREEKLLTTMLGELRGLRERHRDAGPKREPGDGLVDTRGRTWEQIRGDVLNAVLRDTKGNRNAAARQLGIARTTMFKWIAEYDVWRVGRGSDG